MLGLNQIRLIKENLRLSHHIFVRQEPITRYGCFPKHQAHMRYFREYHL